MRAAEADEYVGRIIAQKYRVEELVGEGGMGKVYKARQLMLDKPVVLKVLRQTLLSDERTVARFQREAKAASRLNHPNSISILDFGQTEDGALYIAMEYVHGRDLHQILSMEWPLPERRVVRIVTQVLDSLADAHAAGVIHRDLKPENIMVEQRRNEPDFVKVLDFGIAKLQDSTGEEGPALTRAGFVCGTPEYMSPEQARGAQLDPRSDLYSVGVILYQLTTGLLPFESDSAVGFATRHLTQEPPPPSRRHPQVRISGGMERLILRALSKDPDGRPQTAEAFRAELFAVVSSSPPRKATPVVLAEPQGRPATHPPAQSGTGLWLFKIVTGVLVLSSVGLAGWYLYTQSLNTVAPPSESARKVPVPQPPAPIKAVDTRPLYEQDLPADVHNQDAAKLIARAGDAALREGDLEAASGKYQEAYAKYPDPDYALKLGQVFYLRNDTRAAKGWWDRHLSLNPHSHARAYIQEVLSGK